MGVQKRIPWLFSLGVVLAAMALWGTRAGADVVSDRPGSVVIWPKVIADGTRDTIIKLTNTSNLQVQAHCEYILGTGTCSLTPQYCSRLPAFANGGSPDCTQIPGAPANQCNITWLTNDFDVILTRQQPTFWRVSTGRVEDLTLPANAQCITFDDNGTLRQKCPGLFPIGMVPPAPAAALIGTDADDPTFRGELRCIQVNEDGSPNTANALKGEAVIETLGTNQISEYNAINVIGIETQENGSPLELNSINYNACPEAVDFTHYNLGASDLSAARLGAPCAGTADCVVRTEVTLIPCRAEFLDPNLPGSGRGTRFNAFIETFDEFESSFSRSPQLECWANLDLAALGFTPTSSQFRHTRVTSTGTGLCIAGTNLGQIGCTSDSTPANLNGTGIAGCGTGGVCAPVSGVLAIVEQFHQNDTSLPPPGPPGFPGPPLINVGTDAANAYSLDRNNDGSIQRLGRCRSAKSPGDHNIQCNDDGDCPLGLCRLGSTSCLTSQDCTTTNADCVANDNPAPCCSGAGTGTCPATAIADDFCDRCMNDEISFSEQPVGQQ